MRRFGGSVSNAPRELPTWNLDGRSVKCSAMLTAALHSTTGPCMLKMDTPQTSGPAPMFRESSYGSNDITQSNLQQLQFFAQQQYPPTGSTLSELASVSGVGGYVIVLVELTVTQSNPRERLPGVEGPPEGIHVHETLTCDGVL